MNVSLPPKLNRFVEQKVKDGLYATESDVVSDALRAFIERDQLLRANATNYSLTAVGDSDIEAMAFIVLMQAVKDAENDLRMIMAEVKAITAAKQKVRDLIAKINKDVASNAGQKDGRPPLNFKTGMGNEKAYHQAQMPFADPESEGGVKAIPIDLFRGAIVDVSQIVAIQQDLKDRLDGMNEMSEMTSLRLQMMMDRRSKFISTLSNIMKKISSTNETLLQNMK